ncbi:hypothetical protein N657DRAFT_598255 [Parathielavia appendiculata]|uniref:Shugoshin n=1 Tax=Parathielavia appendiculata TaxID=2587402 RepID=A0AAN6Z1Z4_9PEZI|nr:hypothetical protein N657DRAFT_598255 [Parathielavia appendiculata]
MARLNEPPMPVESHLEILRRKFLRQNRDIAKINADQSQKIKRLENDLARLLSENLDLRGQILRLEKQLEDSHARRIADHALEVKAKLELQLSEFSALLGSLGAEPPSKKRLSEERMLAKSRQSVARSPPARRRRTIMDAEALAEQEGRLPPIYENKTYPRATMNSDEILALCAAAEDISDSPDLGPPPVSRYVEEDSVKQSPSRVVGIELPRSPTPPTISSPVKLDHCTKQFGCPDRNDQLNEIVIEHDNPSIESAEKNPTPTPAAQPVKAGTKRKYGDENGIVHSTKTPAGKGDAVVIEKAFPTRSGQKRKSLAELAGVAPNKAQTKPLLATKRTPLAAKSTNEDVSSPRKVMKAAPLKAVKNAPQRVIESVPREGPIALAPTVEPPAVQHVELESDTAVPSVMPSSPTTPDRPAQKEMLHDTPPPADISSTGETSRPSRRARPAISYAEPNLRDKMRRPTKELFDAVSGEGKFAQRAAATTKSEAHHSGSASSRKPISEPGSSNRSRSKTPALDGPTPKAQQQALASPLAQKEVFPEPFPSSGVTERRKRPSAVASSRESIIALERSDSAGREPSPVLTAQAQATAQQNNDRRKTSPTGKTDNRFALTSPPQEADIYAFTASSPSPFSSKHATTLHTSSEPTNPTTILNPTSTTIASNNNTNNNNTQTFSRLNSRPARKSSMAAAAALRELLDEEELHAAKTINNNNHTKPSSRPAHAGRKRASMLAPKKSSMLDDGDGSEEVAAAAATVYADENEEADTSAASASSSADGKGGGGGGGLSGKDARITRRRSMML